MMSEPEQPGFDPNDEAARQKQRALDDVARRQELGLDSELMQSPKAGTLRELTRQVDQILNYNPEASYHGTTDFNLGDGVYASVGYGKTNGQDNEQWSLRIDRYVNEEGVDVDPEAEEGPELIAEFGLALPDTEAGIDAPMPQELPPTGKVYDHEAFGRMAERARKRQQPQLLIDALRTLAEIDEDEETGLPEPSDGARASYDQAARSLLELGRLIPRSQVIQMVQRFDRLLPGADEAIHIWQVVEPGLQSTGREVEVKYRSDTWRIRKLKLNGDGTPPTFTDVREPSLGEWKDAPDHGRGFPQPADEALISEAGHGLDKASEGDVNWVLGKLHSIDGRR